MAITTKIEVEKGYAYLERPEHQSYIYPKIHVANIAPKTTTRTVKNKIVTVNLKQITMSALVWLDEKNHDYLWYYKAEVSFDVPRTGPPIPILTNNSTDKNRRHSHNPFAPKVLPGSQRRRPDMIVVKNKNIRWPGLKAVYPPTGASYEDNLSRVVEIKFEGDRLGKEQRDDYIQIAGSTKRFTVLNVSSQSKPQDGKTLADPLPVYAPKPQSQGYFAEEWMKQGKQWVDSILIPAETKYKTYIKKAHTYSAKAENYLRKEAPWMFNSGRFIQDKTAKTWKWIDEKGNVVRVWTQQQLNAAIKEIQRITDWTIAELKKIDWFQVLIVGGVIIFVVAVGTVVTFFSSGVATAPYAAAVQTLLISFGIGSAAVVAQ